ncbi:MAG: APH(3') family aminoglycoside O-phosphotransferase [Blastomonas sp.]
MTEGGSQATVYRLTAPGCQTLYLKTEEAGPFAELPSEAVRLRWMALAGLPVPKLEAELRHDNGNWLLTCGLPGRSLDRNPELRPVEIVRIMAEAMLRLHTVDIAACPFDHRLETRIAYARQRMLAGQVDVSDFDEERTGRNVEELYRELEEMKPLTEDLVFTHGDFCNDNLIAEEGRFTGFVDCGRAGVADRYQALAWRTIARNLGEECTAMFFRLYGIVPDERRLRFFCLLDEFF